MITDKKLQQLREATSYWLGEIGRGKDRFAQLNYDACVEELTKALEEIEQKKQTEANYESRN